MNRASLLCLSALVASHATARPGPPADPIVVHMKRGADTVRLAGDLRPNVDCCAYSIRARAGQSLFWLLAGPGVRVIMTYPDGHTDGPGLASAIPLPADGGYVFSVTPDLMADGAFGRYTLTLRIPPLAGHRPVARPPARGGHFRSPTRPPI
jgi:hypothetical protein